MIQKDNGSLTVKLLLEKGVHLGHKKNYWNPLMIEYIYGIRHDLHIFDLEKTLCSLRNSCRFVRSVIASKGKILFVCSDERFYHIIEQTAQLTNQPYIVGRWIGGLLTNLTSLQKTRLDSNFSKKKYRSLHELRVQRGIEQLDSMPSALFIVGDSRSAIAEASLLNIPIVKVCDSTSNPSLISYIIPGNDDSIQCVAMYCNVIADSIREGQRLQY
uniref:Ribosomal protein S2 n=1 Tax=Jakoba bahamiensis TaxID=221721 RepID=M4Q9L5_9EUKA|nr:ribosomal protein S2 [Jakoba bahamiensis]AGH24112.1 ribosomal protein S2 [Jakoba bahamiensis]